MSKLLPLHEKIVSREALLHARGRPRTGRLVFTNGVFDVLHRGHVEYLFAARALGDELGVALNRDASARRLGKGVDRPVNAQQDRAIVLAGLGRVDFLTFFDEDTPQAIVAELLP